MRRREVKCVSRILRSFVRQTAERTSESVCIMISDVRLVIRMICVWSRMRRGFLCMLRIYRDIQSAECLLISKYLCWLSEEEDMSFSLAESLDMQNDLENCKNGNLFGGCFNVYQWKIT